MAVEAIEKSGFLGFKKHHEKITPGKTYDFILQPGNLKRTVKVVKDNEVTVYDNTGDNGGFKIEYLIDEWINRSKLKVPGENGKKIFLKWKEK
jgi:hypothetical protein